jgi:site-specific recombinase XerD
MLPNEIESFTDYLKTRHYSPHTIANYELDLRLFFALIEKPPAQVTWRDVDCFLQQQHRQGLAPTTVNRRIHALKSFYEFLFVTAGDEYPMPIKPSHYVRQGRPLPKKLTANEVKRLFAQITNEVDKTLFLLMLRCGLRVAEVAALRLPDIDWTEKALVVRQGKGRKDRRLYLSNDILASLEQLVNPASASDSRSSRFLESETPFAAVVNQGDSEKDGTLCKVGRHQSQLPLVAAHVRLEPARSGSRSGLHQGISRA